MQELKTGSSFCGFCLKCSVLEKSLPVMAVRPIRNLGPANYGKSFLADLFIFFIQISLGKTKQKTNSLGSKSKGKLS